MVQKDKTLEAPPVDVEQSPSPVSGEACVEAPGPVEESDIVVEATGHRKFISGVVEGNIEYTAKTIRFTMQSYMRHRQNAAAILLPPGDDYCCQLDNK